MPIPGDSTSLADQQDLEDALLRPLTSDEASRAQRRLDRAQNLLASAVPNLLVRVAAFPGGTAAIDPDVAAEVIAGIVARQLRNPKGVTSQSRTAGPFVTTDSFRDQDGPGSMYVNDDDIATLVGSGGYTMPGTIRLGLPTLWLDDPCSPQG